ncbi:hypothetical protein HBB16_20800 [Pseudonocardia sp. MCCB 268]|nr:hypothetical protein [Pseudonocardia cytotoxica]
MLFIIALVTGLRQRSTARHEHTGADGTTGGVLAVDTGLVARTVIPPPRSTSVTMPAGLRNWCSPAHRQLGGLARCDRRLHRLGVAAVISPERVDSAQGLRGDGVIVN